jgi:FRG domain
MGTQVFGTIETVQGTAQATLLIDDDTPMEFMIQWYGKDIVTGGAVSMATVVGDTINLVPRVVCRATDSGGIYVPVTLTADEIKWRDGTKATLRRTARGLEGEWTGPDNTRGAISFPKIEPARVPMAATQCASWDDFKKWASTCRSAHGVGWFRGHGCNSYSLQTTLHRAGRYRMERYFSNQVGPFKNYAEAFFNRRFNLADAGDYSTIIALGQHHGLPSPMLDWTESPYIAAFFAFSDAVDAMRTRPESTHVRVYALSQQMIDGSSPPIVTVTWPHPFVASLSVAPLHNPRLSAQQGRFMVTNVADVEAFIRRAEVALNARHLFAVDIQTSCAAEALQDLAFMGLTAATMFPGLDGVTRMIKHEMFYKKVPTIDSRLIPEQLTSGAASASA